MGFGAPEIPQRADLLIGFKKRDGVEVMNVLYKLDLIVSC
jgi:hypothetical protein